MKRSYSLLKAALPLAGALALAAGCSNDVVDPQRDSQVRFINASPDAPPLDVLVQGTVVGNPLGSGQVTTYITVTAGSESFAMRQTGTTSTLINTTQTLVGQGAYTFLAIGPFAALEPLFLADDNAVPAAPNAKLRATHVAPSAGALDVYLTAPGADLNAAQPTFSELSFRLSGGYTMVPAGTYQVRLTQAGTKTVVADAGNFTFGETEVHSLFVLDGAPLQVASLFDAT